MLKLLMCLLPLLLAHFSYAETMNCSEIKNINELLGFISSKHPEISYANDLNENNRYLVDIAKQRPNPTLTLQYDTRNNDTQRVHNTEVSVLHTFELGGKRDARIKLAKSQQKLFGTKINQQLEDTYIEAITQYFKYQHHKKLISNYEEAVETFNKVIGIKKKREFLSPEDRAQLIAIEVAVKDYELKIRNLENESEKIQLSFNYIFNQECNIDKMNVDKDIHRILDESVTSKVSSNYSRSIKAQRQFELAQANADYQESLGSTNLQVGPFFTINNQNQGQDTSVGIALNVGLPIYHTNKAARLKSAEMIKISKRYQAQIKQQTTSEAYKWRAIYLSAQKSLKNSISENELIKKHKEMDKLFKRGIVSTSSMIEVHRQIIEYDLSKHDQEEQMLEAVLRLKAINGTLISSKVTK